MTNLDIPGSVERYFNTILSSNFKISKTQDVLYFYRAMRPDYPHKTFPDSRNHFFLLMETLAMMPATVSLLS